MNPTARRRGGAQSMFSTLNMIALAEMHSYLAGHTGPQQLGR